MTDTTQTTAEPKSTAPALPRWRQESLDALKTARKFATHLQTMVERDANESDTRLIVTDVLTEVFGFDKYLDLTTEYQIRGEFADYGLRIDGQLVAFVEVKRAAQKLTDKHLRQVESYGLREGVDWLILTNGMQWRVYRLVSSPGAPSSTELLFEFSLTQITKEASLLHKQALKRGLLGEEWDRIRSLSPTVLKNALGTERVLAAIRAEINTLTGRRPSTLEVQALIAGTVS